MVGGNWWRNVQIRPSPSVHEVLDNHTTMVLCNNDIHHRPHSPLAAELMRNNEFIGVAKVRALYKCLHYDFIIA